MNYLIFFSPSVTSRKKKAARAGRHRHNKKSKVCDPPRRLPPSLQRCLPEWLAASGPGPGPPTPALPDHRRQPHPAPRLAHRASLNPEPSERSRRDSSGGAGSPDPGSCSGCGPDFSSDSGRARAPPAALAAAAEAAAPAAPAAATSSSTAAAAAAAAALAGFLYVGSARAQRVARAAGGRAGAGRG